MTEYTKKLFNAPWKVYPLDYVGDAEGYQLCSAVDEITAKRIEHLPELYDALMEAKNEIYIMLNEWALGKSAVEYLESYQKRKGRENHEFFNEIQELLKKVQEGK